MSLQELTVIKIVSILHISCGVMLRNVECLEALVVVYDLVIVLDGEAHAHEDLLDLTGRKGDRMI